MAWVQQAAHRSWRWAASSRAPAALVAPYNSLPGVAEGRIAADESPLHHAPHTLEVVTADEWDRSYSRQQAAWPAGWLRGHKYWPTVSRIDNAYGDRNLVCSCPSVESYAHIQ